LVVLETTRTPVTAFEYKTQPYKHQLKALKVSCFLPEFALLCDMGTGKSKIIIDNACILYEAGRIQALFVLAPNSVYRNWSLREIPTHIPDHIKHRVWVYKQDNIEILRRFLEHPGPLSVLLANTEAFSTRKDMAHVLGTFMEIVPTMMVVDESPMIKQIKAERTKTIIHMGQKAAYRRIATGMVAPNGPMDLFGQFQFLRDGCLGTRSPVAFKARYCKVMPVRVGRSMMKDKIIGVQNQEELRAIVDRLSFRVTKEECLDLPDKTYEFIESELDEESHFHYKKMKEEALFQIENEDPDESVFIRSTNRINMVMRLQMITCGHIKDTDGREIRFSNRRIKDTLEVLDRIRGPVIVWSVFTKDIEDLTIAIRKEWGHDSCVQYFGGTTLTMKDDAINRFMSGKSRFFVANQASGRFGLTLTASSTAVYYSNNWDLEHRMQSEDRIHRIGQKSTCLYIDIIAPGTVNDPIVKSLRKKLDMASIISGDEVKKWLI
jgi:SNF2 family DNA or RNA helicase